MAEKVLDLSKEQMNIVFVGHVDHGKSTVIGRLLAETDSLPKGKLEQVRKNCETKAIPFEYAYLIDALKDEQAQSITIDAARVFFESRKRHYIIIDAPGHVEFIKNMVTGAARAEAAVLVIDAEEGVQENSRRHGYLLWMLGIKKIVVLVNKMDLVNYREDVYQKVVRDYQEYLKEINVEPLCYIPVSGVEGENISALSSKMPWYQGETVLSALDSFEKAPPMMGQPFRMPVQDVYKFTRFGDHRRIIAGRVSSGSLHIGDKVIFYPSGKSSTVKTIEAFNSPEKTEVVSGLSAGFTMEEQIYTHRGEVVVRLDEPRPQVSKRFRVSLFWLGKNPLQTNKQYLLKIGTGKVKMQVEEICKVIDASDYSSLNGRTQVNRHEVAECILSVNHAIAYDLAESQADTSRFVIVDDYEIRGGGIIIESLEDEVSDVRDRVFIRDLKWIKSSITNEQRAENYNQRSAMIIITGKSGVGRKRVARSLEKDLFQSGKLAYYLGIGSVLYGVDSDIKGVQSQGEQPEHIRRLAEVSYILMDAGLILIVTAIELKQSDLKIIKTVVGTNRVKTVWLGDDVTTDIAFDMHLPNGDLAENSAIQIKRMMQDAGIIFSP